MNVYIPGNGFATQGPCDDGFHVPTNTEWNNLINMGVSLGAWNTTTQIGILNFRDYLKLPPAGFRAWNGNISSVNDRWYYWISDGDTSDNKRGILYIYYSSTIFSITSLLESYACSIREFKDTPVVPDSSWIKTYSGTGDAGIYWSSTLGLISVSTDGTNWITIADKNLGATEVYVSGDTVVQNTGGNYYQRGNNYGFPFTGTLTTSSTAVDASNYGPGNYYSNSTFIAVSTGWDSSNNANLWGGVDGNVQVVNELQNAYIGEYVPPIYLGEYIEYKMTADSAGYLNIPLSGRNHSNNTGAAYNWKYKVDNGQWNTNSGYGSNGGRIALTGYTAGSSHTIRIEPVTEAYGRALAYGWAGSTPGKTNVTEIIYDCSYMGYAVSETNTGDYFRANVYNGCTGLTSTCEEYLPDTVTTIGNYFRFNEYRTCTSLPYAKEECLPNSITSIGTYFRQYQYYEKTFTEIKGWKDLSTTIGGSNYRSSQFGGTDTIRTIKVLSDLGPSATTSGINNNVTTVYVPSAYLSNFRDTTVYAPRKDIDDSKFVGY